MKRVTHCTVGCPLTDQLHVEHDHLPDSACSFVSVTTSRSGVSLELDTGVGGSSS